MGFQNSVDLTELTETYLDEEAKQSLLKYASVAARSADTDLVAALREGMLFYLDDLNVLQVQRNTTDNNVSTIGPVHGALTSWTPVVVQGATPTLTFTTRTYSRVGRMITSWFHINVTSAGTAANAITVSLPVTAAGSTGSVGYGFVYDSSAAIRWDGQITLASTTTAKFTAPNAAGDQYQGSASSGGFNAALGSGDLISGFITYEAAADA